MNDRVMKERDIMQSKKDPWPSKMFWEKFHQRTFKQSKASPCMQSDFGAFYLVFSPGHFIL